MIIYSLGQRWFFLRSRQKLCQKLTLSVNWNFLQLCIMQIETKTNFIKINLNLKCLLATGLLKVLIFSSVSFHVYGIYGLLKSEENSKIKNIFNLICCKKVNLVFLRFFRKKGNKKFGPTYFMYCTIMIFCEISLLHMKQNFCFSEVFSFKIFIREKNVTGLLNVNLVTISNS